MRNRFNVDYYITEKSKNPTDYDTYDIIDKLKVNAISSSGTLDENFDIFIRKADFPVNKMPREHDMAFFIEELKFYKVKSSEDAGDFYIVNIYKYRCN